MNARLTTACLVLFCAPLVAQAPSTAPQLHTFAMGFSYALPADWQVSETQPTLTALKQQQTQTASSDEEKKGLACAQIAMTARHGNPVSMVSVTTLPFYCFGKPVVDTDLPGFAQAAMDDLKKNFVLGDAIYGTYALGAHSVWIVRANGSVFGQPDKKYTAEVACTLLKQGAVCWGMMAADADALHTFERGKVILDGEQPVALVPTVAFDKPKE